MVCMYCMHVCVFVYAYVCVYATVFVIVADKASAYFHFYLFVFLITPKILIDELTNFWNHRPHDSR